MTIKELNDGSLLIEERAWGIELIVVVILIFATSGAAINAMIEFHFEFFLLVEIAIILFLIIIAKKIYQLRTVQVKLDINASDITYYYRRSLQGIVKYPLNWVKTTLFDPETRNFYLVLDNNIRLLLYTTLYEAKRDRPAYSHPMLIRDYEAKIHAWLEKHHLGRFKNPKVVKTPDMPALKHASKPQSKWRSRGDR